MKKILNITFATIFSLSILSSCSSNSNNNLLNNQLQNQTNQNVNNEFNALGLSAKRFSISFDSSNRNLTKSSLESSLGVKILRFIPQIGMAMVEKPVNISNNNSISTFSDSLSRNKSVIKSEPLKLVKLEAVKAFKANDPLMKNQYHTDLLNLPEAWGVTRGKKSIKIAIVDTGIDLNHPDLKNKIVQGRNIPKPNQKPMDDNGHGTHVAGLAAASTNNNTGVVGVAPNCSIMPVKVLTNGSGTDFDIAEGVVWAVDNDASVINISIGLYTKSEALEKAVEYAIKKNVVVVSSAGNESKNSRIHLPSMIKGVIEVSASTDRDKVSYFTNYGQQISVAAPGHKVYSTMPTYNVPLTNEAGLKYGYLSGSSMSSPIVAGLAALIKSQKKDLTVSSIKRRLEVTAKDLGSKGYDKYYGHGRVDAFKAVSVEGQIQDLK